MLLDGIQLLGASTATNFTIANGATLPTTGNILGELFYQTSVGLHVYDGAAWVAVGGGGGGSGTVTSTSIVTANGISGSVATATTTPAITLTLGDITPTSVAATGAISGSTLTVSGAASFTSYAALKSINHDVADVPA
jgi:hypothetical protein